MHTYTHAHTHTYICTHTHNMYTHIHTHTHTQLRLAEQEKAMLQEQLAQLQQEVGSCNLEILELSDKLKRARVKLSERKRHSTDKLYASK